jgi:AcrR family transcriptional regulator
VPKSPEKMREVKDRIFRAAIELFKEQGYENTSIEQITKKANVSKGTFFTHFPSKNSIFSAVGKILLNYMEEDSTDHGHLLYHYI